MTLTLGLLLACSDKGGDDSGEPLPDPTLYEVYAGAAPWDGFRTKVLDDRGQEWTPLLEYAGASPIAVEAGSFPALAQTLWTGPGGELPEGAYTATGLEGFPDQVALDFSVLPYGRDLAFRPADIADGAWLLDMGTAWPELVDVAVGADDGSLVLLVDEAREGSADFRVIYSSPEVSCLGLVGTGDLTATGELTWDTPSMPVTTKPALLAEDFTLRLGFSGDGQAVGGVQAHTRVDLRELSTWVYASQDPEALCRAWSSMGGVCEACADDGVEGCATVGFQWATGARTDRLPAWEKLPDCAVVFEEDLIPECSCSSGPGGAVGGAWLMGLLALRRRARGPRPAGRATCAGCACSTSSANPASPAATPAGP